MFVCKHCGSLQSKRLQKFLVSVCVSLKFSKKEDRYCGGCFHFSFLQAHGSKIEFVSVASHECFSLVRYHYHPSEIKGSKAVLISKAI